jgi:hypothetical protein
LRSCSVPFAVRADLRVAFCWCLVDLDFAIVKLKGGILYAMGYKSGGVYIY